MGGGAANVQVKSPFYLHLFPFFSIFCFCTFSLFIFTSKGVHIGTYLTHVLFITRDNREWGWLVKIIYRSRRFFLMYVVH